MGWMTIRHRQFLYHCTSRIFVHSDLFSCDNTYNFVREILYMYIYMYYIYTRVHWMDGRCGIPRMLRCRYTHTYTSYTRTCIYSLCMYVPHVPFNVWDIHSIIVKIVIIEKTLILILLLLIIIIITITITITITIIIIMIMMPNI